MLPLFNRIVGEVSIRSDCPIFVCIHKDMLDKILPLIQMLIQVLISVATVLLTTKINHKHEIERALKAHQQTLQKEILNVKQDLCVVFDRLYRTSQALEVSITKMKNLQNDLSNSAPSLELHSKVEKQAKICKLQYASWKTNFQDAQLAMSQYRLFLGEKQLSEYINGMYNNALDLETAYAIYVEQRQEGIVYYNANLYIMPKSDFLSNHGLSDLNGIFSDFLKEILDDIETGKMKFSHPNE